jgi:hypothetical protein
MADNEYANHELFQNTDAAPPPETAPVQQPRDDSGRFASKSDESAPESDDLEAVAEVEASEEPAAEEAGDSDEVESQEDEREERPKPRRKASERISQLTAQRKEAEARAQQAEQELYELREYLQQQVDPNLEFEDPAKFQQETVRRALAEQRAHDTALTRQRSHEAQIEADRAMFFERLEDVRDSLPDFEQVVLNNPSLPIDADMVSFFAESEVGPQIAHHLGKHPSLAQRIAAMPPARKGVELARLESKLATPPPKRTTKAPPPPRAIQASGSAGVFDPQRSSVDDFKSLIYGKRG